ncbi:MAG: 4Fe-4S dicluster domain-containing protein [Gammaproteobacteria bacterium]
MTPRFPSTDYAFRYRDPPVSGNRINGLGDPERRRPVQIFHSSGMRRVEWELLELFFLLSMPLRLFLPGLISRWILRRADGPVAAHRLQASQPAAQAAEIKEIAMRLGASAVGISEVTDDALFRNYSTPYRYAISIGYAMDYDEMEHVTGMRGGIETMRAYIEITRIVVKLAGRIRAMGWPARAYCESADILHIPLAINAGIGQLGKHGSVINREVGSNFRLATVLTDLPMATDRPVDIGVEDLCLGCRRCTIDCPADAISDRKQLVRGIEKWYVDFDKCVPYFVKTFGCGICIQVCPWSKPGRGPGLSETHLEKRTSNDPAHATSP